MSGEVRRIAEALVSSGRCSLRHGKQVCLHWLSARLNWNNFFNYAWDVLWAATCTNYQKHQSASSFRASPFGLCWIIGGCSYTVPHQTRNGFHLHVDLIDACSDKVRGRKRYQMKKKQPMRPAYVVSSLLCQTAECKRSSARIMFTKTL